VTVWPVTPLLGLALVSSLSPLPVFIALLPTLLSR
jgi:hypothetical protein